MKKNFFAAALALGTATLASALLSAPAKAQTTTTVPVTVTIPDIIYLETYASLTFEPQLSDLSTDPTAIGTPIQTEAGTNNFTSSTITSTNGLNGGGSITIGGTKELTGVILYKVWGLGGDDGDITHGVTYSGDLEKGSNGSIIGLTLANNLTTEDAPGLDYGNAIEGTADLTFDFSGVKEAGDHTGGTLTITATAE